MKRDLDDSDNDDLYDDDLKAGSPSQSYHMSDRKKRRGVIEKRRRDRINSSLTELRRLVPAAFEKQGSAKLEKAEILQMAVDHLKTLNAKGIAGYNIDTAALAMDYRMIGFRECAAEVARYLVSIEGMDIQDPLRLRVMNHLQCYCAQRESAAAKASLHNGNHSWNHHASMPGAVPSNLSSSQYGGGAMAPPAGILPSSSQHNGNGSNHMDQLVMAAHPPYIEHGVSGSGLGGARMSHHQSDGGNHSMRLSSANMSSGQISSNNNCSSSSSVQMGAPPSVLSGLHPSVHAPFFGSMPMLSPNSLHYNASMALSQGMRPYRPWGAELVY